MEDITATAAGTITLGDLTVNRLGLGTNRITDTLEAHAVLKRAIELDITFIDTAYRYAGGQSETTIGKVLAPYDGLVIATKGGWEDASPADLRDQLEESLRRLRTDHIDLYQLHRLNPNIPLEDSVGMLKTLQEEGKVRHIGLSEVTVEQLDRARKVVPIVSVQNQYNIITRTHEALVNYCTQQHIAFIPWFPLGGLAGDAEKVAVVLADLAAKYQASAQQISLAWLLQRSPMMLPIPGTLSIAHLEDNVRSTQLKLSDEDYDQLTAVS